MEERLQKYMADCGIASRRKCEEIIIEKRVKVNNTLVTELGYKINRNNDVVYVDGKKISPQEIKKYIALNKPIGYVSTVKDEKNRQTILDIVKVKERIYPIGRLDYNTSGLILLTNDGEVYNNIIHPRKSIDKIYEAIIDGTISTMDIIKFEKGIDIGDYITAPAKIQILKSYDTTTKVKITIHEGKNRQIRRMCEAIGHPVIELKRISIGEIKLGDLPSGKWRDLKDIEVEYIKQL
jgi:23S rRNA pseudouridine2605 synthase